MDCDDPVPVPVDHYQLPDHDKNLYNFKDSFFRGRGFRLPTPNDVRQLAALQTLPTGKISTSPLRNELIIPPEESIVWRNRPVIFPGMNLLVKWGGLVRPEEAITMHKIRTLFPRLPVPEVYAWRRDGADVFIYMEHVQGHTLASIFDEMTFSEHALVIQALRDFVSSLRLMRQACDKFVGSIVNTKVRDKALASSPYRFFDSPGPFKSMAAFHDEFARERSHECKDGFCPIILGTDPHRHDLPDSWHMRFTHGDLQRSNVIVSLTRPYRVVAVVDWEEAGWMPDYWEVCKAHHAAVLTDKWSEMYLPDFLDKTSVNESVRNAWDWFVWGIHVG